MEQYPLVSVIVPVYNVEKYITRCIDSIIGQTYANLQIILVDDGSPDNSGAICDEYTKRDSRIMVVHQENEGVSGARNNGLLFAEGSLIAFVDSDDWLHPEMYETLVGMMKNYELDMARCSVVETDGTQERNIQPHGKIANQIMTGKDIFELYFTEFLVKPIWNSLYKKNLVQGIFPPERCRFEDNYVSGRYLYRSQRMMIIDRPLYYYFKNPSSITQSGNILLIDACICTKQLRDDLMKIESMDDDKYLTLLNYKLSREIYHSIRAKSQVYRVSAINKELKLFVNKYLDFGRKIRFNWLLYLRRIKIY